MIGQTISHYQILEKLGEGGMGVVYKAHDTKLDRIVALKFLPPHVSINDETKTRFLQEARAAAALNHPNICTIHSIEEHGDQQFIAMEYVDGVTLRQKIPRVEASTPKTLPMNDAISYAIQIGEALQEAHMKGIVHRDIKAENVMVNARNQAKIMDFGLAKLKGSLKLTRTSSTVGTLAYMAPEQLQGGEVDARSDIFAFGVLFFELLTGRLPFRGEHDAAMMYSIVNEEPESLQKYLSDVPSVLSHILNRTLEKDPGERYQSVGDMVIELRRLRKESAKVSRETFAALKPPPVPRRSLKRIMTGGIGLFLLAAATMLLWNPATDRDERLPVAVIDFTNETGDKELDGLSGLLITGLEQSKRLEVLTRSRMFDVLRRLNMGSVERIDETNGRALCRTAGITVMAIGTVKKFGELYTVDLKVIDLGNDKHLFAAKADGRGKETIPSLIDKIAEQMRSELKEPSEHIKANSQKVAELTTTNLQAYQHYFQGEQLLGKGMLADARGQFEQAVSIDSSFGLAYYRMASVVPWQGGVEQVERARRPLKKALALLDRIPARWQYSVRALDALLEDGAGAALSILSGIESSFPKDKELFYELGVYYWYIHQNSKAEEYIEKSLQIDPSFQRAGDMLLQIYFTTGEFEKTLAEGVRRLHRNPADLEARLIIADSHIILGNERTGFAEYDSVLRFARTREEILRLYTHRAGAKVFQGRFKEARQEYLEALVLNEQDSPTQKQSGYFLELCLGLLEDRLHHYDAAVRHFQQSLKFSPKTLRVYRDLGATYARMGKIALAQEIVDSILTSRAGLDHRYFNHVSGEIALAQKQYQQAIALLRKSCGEFGLQSSLYCYPLSTAYLQDDNLSAAISVLESVVKTRLTFYGLEDYQLIFYYPLSLFTLAQLYEQNNQISKAVDTYGEFLKVWKEADRDLPELVEAKSRLARLKGLANK